MAECLLLLFVSVNQDSSEIDISRADILVALKASEKQFENSWKGKRLSFDGRVENAGHVDVLRVNLNCNTRGFVRLERIRKKDTNVTNIVIANNRYDAMLTRNHDRAPAVMARIGEDHVAAPIRALNPLTNEGIFGAICVFELRVSEMFDHPTIEFQRCTRMGRRIEIRFANNPKAVQVVGLLDRGEGVLVVTDYSTFFPRPTGDLVLCRVSHEYSTAQDSPYLLSRFKHEDFSVVTGKVKLVETGENFTVSNSELSEESYYLQDFGLAELVSIGKRSGGPKYEWVLFFVAGVALCWLAWKLKRDSRATNGP